MTTGILETLGIDMSDFDSRPVIDLKDVVDTKFAAGEGILLINPDMDDKTISLVIRKALRAANGKGFVVQEAGH